MDCPRCRGAVPEGSRYCNHCGMPLASYPPAGGDEVELWRGSPSVKAFALPILLGSVWSAAVLVAALLVWDRQAAWGAALLVGGPVAYLGTEVLARKMAVRYALTSRRLFVEEGFLVRRLEETDLTRVEDVIVVQSLPQRFADVGDVVLFSSDPSTPRVTLSGVERPMRVKEAIRERSAEMRRGVLSVRTV